jgi:hypothetical protein
MRRYPLPRPASIKFLAVTAGVTPPTVHAQTALVQYLPAGPAVTLEPSAGGERCKARLFPVLGLGKCAIVHERQTDGSWRRNVEKFNVDATSVTSGGRP